MSAPPEPMTPADCDLRGYEYMPLFGHRLFTSRLNDRASDAEFRAALRLWWAAWQQCPAGSLPDDDSALARLADFGRDVKGWRKVREIAMHGFVMCSDGRLYHPMLCEAAVRAYASKLKTDHKRETDRRRLQAWRDAKRKRDTETTGNDGGNGSDTRDETVDETRFDTPDETRAETQNVEVREERREDERRTPPKPPPAGGARRRRGPPQFRNGMMAIAHFMEQGMTMDEAIEEATRVTAAH